MRTLRLAAVSLLLMIQSPLAFAQEAPALPPPVMFVAGFLQLTEPQIHDLVRIVQDRDTAIRPVAEGVHAKQMALAELLGTASPDPAKVGELVLEIRTGEKRAAEISQSAAASFANILTSEQQQRMEAIILANQVAPVVPAFKALGLV
jgi:Spy/CpxP family protein refolding chaperone